MKCTHDYGQCGVGGNCINCPDQLASQITKREMIASMQMQKLNSGNYFNLEDMASDAVREADALLAELEKAG